jgi:hypothetical protein
MASNAAEQSDEFTRPMGAARATAQMFDSMAAPLTRAIEQNERELGIVREDRAREPAIVAEAEPGSADAFEHCAEFAGTDTISRERVEIFHDECTLGLLEQFEADLRLDGLHPSGIGIRRNARGGIAGVVILLGPREGGR